MPRTESLEPGREAAEKGRTRTPAALVAILLGVVLILVGLLGAAWGAAATPWLPWPLAILLVVLGAVLLAYANYVRRRHGGEAGG